MEISVELKLQLQTLKRQIAEARKMLQRDFNVAAIEGTRASAKSSKEAANEMENLDKKIKETTKSLKDQKEAALAAWRASLPQPKVTMAGSSEKPKEEEDYEAKEEARKKKVEELIGERPKRTPVEAEIPSANPEEDRESRIKKEAAEARRQDQLEKDRERERLKVLREQGKPPVIPSAKTSLKSSIAPFANIASASGIPMAGQLLRAVLNPAVAATAVALLALHKAIRETLQAYENARTQYARQLQSGGMPAAFLQQRSVLSQVIGVSEREVYQFGAAIKQISPSIQVATRTFTESNRTLTATGWNLKIMSTNLSAVWAEIAKQLSPVVNQITKMISSFAEFIIVTGRAELAGKTMAFIVKGIANEIGAIIAAMELVQLAFTALVDSIQWLAQKIQNIFLGLIGRPELQDHSDKFKETKEGAEAFKKLIEAMVGKNNEQAPAQNLSSINRLQASPWEKMGLVIGQGTGTNYSMQTAKNTKEAVTLLSKISEAIARSGTPQFTIPTYSQP